MADFSIREAAFTGFRIVRERPIVIPWWTAYQMLTTLAVLLLLSAMDGAAFDHLAQAAVRGDAKAAMDLGPRLAGPMLAGAAINIVAMAIQQAAFNRAVFTPSDSAFGYLRLGLAELRQLLLSLQILLIFVGLELIGSVFATLFSGLLKQQALALALTFMVGAGIVVGLRLCMASAATYDQGRVDLVTAFRLSRGRMNALLGCYLLVVLMAVLVWFLSSIVVEQVLALGGLGAPRLASPMALLTPQALLGLILNSISAALFAPILGAPGATIYLQLTGRGGNS
jgi:hypothetical protein